MAARLPIVDVFLLDEEANPAPFHLTFYGVPLAEFMIIPGGFERIRAALDRRGLTGYQSSPYHIQERPFRLQTEPRSQPADPDYMRWVMP